jgi:hypothetical protein
MTKDTELKILDDTIKRLGQDSYLGPWLMMNYDAIASDIQSDLPVSMVLPKAAHFEGMRMIAEAKKQAEEIRMAANIWASTLRDQTRDEIVAAKQRARQALISVADRI